jgi:hypothetical protein
MNSTESSALIAVSGSDTLPKTARLSVRCRPAKQGAQYSDGTSDARAARAVDGLHGPVAQMHRTGA